MNITSRVIVVWVCSGKFLHVIWPPLPRASFANLRKCCLVWSGWFWCNSGDKRHLQHTVSERACDGVVIASQDAERIESAKAGAVAAVGGLLGSLPYLAVQGQSQISTALSAAQVVASCLLFGVTFRYVQSAGAGNPQLKAGTVAAFGMVRYTLRPTSIVYLEQPFAKYCDR